MKHLGLETFDERLFLAIEKKYIEPEAAKVARERLKKELSFIGDEQKTFFLEIEEYLAKENINKNLLLPKYAVANSLILYLMDLNPVDPIRFSLSPDLFYKPLLEGEGKGYISYCIPGKENKDICVEFPYGHLALKEDDGLNSLKALTDGKGIDFDKFINEGDDLTKEFFGENKWPYKMRGKMKGDNFLGIIDSLVGDGLKGNIKELNLEGFLNAYSVSNFCADIFDVLEGCFDIGAQIPCTQDSLHRYVCFTSSSKEETFKIDYWSQMRGQNGMGLRWWKDDPDGTKKKEMPKESIALLKKNDVCEDIIDILKMVYYLPTEGELIAQIIKYLALFDFKMRKPYEFYVAIMKDNKLDGLDEGSDLYKEKSYLNERLLLEAQARGLDIAKIVKATDDNGGFDKNGGND